MTLETIEDDMHVFKQHIQISDTCSMTEVVVLDHIEEIDPTEYDYERVTDPEYDSENNGHVLGDPDEFDDELLEWTKEE